MRTIANRSNPFYTEIVLRAAHWVSMSYGIYLRIAAAAGCTLLLFAVALELANRGVQLFITYSQQPWWEPATAGFGLLAVCLGSMMYRRRMRSRQKLA